MIPRTLEPEVMDTVEEAVDYDAMDHAEVNRVFVDHMLEAHGGSWRETNSVLQVLDFGTGTAQIPIELCGRHKSCQVTAIDLAEEMLKVGQQNCQQAGFDDRIRLKLEDAKAVKLPDDSFDVVMSNSIIHHIPEPLCVLQEMVRVLRPGGLLFVRDLMRPDSSARVEEFVTTYAADESPHQKQMFRQSLHAALTVGEMQSMLSECGLPRDWVRATSDRHWTICGLLEAVD